MTPPPSGSPLGPIHHVGYVVADLDAAIAQLDHLLSAPVTVREIMDSQGVEAAMCATRGGLIELITPLDPDGAIARFMEKRGEGFHHVAFAVPDAAATLADLAARGAELIDTAPRWASVAIWWRSCIPVPRSGCSPRWCRTTTASAD